MSRPAHRSNPVSTAKEEKATVHPCRRIANRSARGAARTLALAVAALGVAATPALAAPSFGLEMVNDANEVQAVGVMADTGQYRLRYEGHTTPDLNVTDSPAQVQAALNALPTIAAGGGSVSVESGGGNPKTRIIVFDEGPLAGTDVPAVEVAFGTMPLNGGAATAFVNTVVPGGVARNDERIDYVVKVKNTGPDPTSGEVTVEVELPEGDETAVFDGTEAAGGSATGGSGWNCTKQASSGAEPAKAICKRSDALAPGATYPTLNVAAALGADAPDHAVATATVSGGGATATSDGDEFDFLPAKVFEIEAFNSEVINADNSDYKRAGGHPHAAFVNFAFMTRKLAPDELQFPVKQPRQVVTDLPRGFVGNALSVPELCPGMADVIASTCPAASAIGEINVDVVINSNGGGPGISMPLFAIEPEYGAPAQFGFAELNNTQAIFALTPRLRAEDGYALSIETTPAAAGFTLRTVNRAGFCDFGANVSGNTFLSCKKAGDPNANPVPLITNPTRCTGAPPAVKVNVDSWQDPGEFISRESVDPLPEGCEEVDFTPEVSIVPTNQQADTPTGVEVEVTMPTEGLESPNKTAQSNLNNAVVTLPKGMALNPAASHGLGSCTPAQVKLGSNADHECPLSSQVGTIEIDTPLIENTLKGHAFLATQRDNPFKSTLGLYLVFSSEKDGVTIKVAGKLEADPVTGQITSSFVENPEAPFSRLSLKFNSGPRAPLINPPKCGTYAIRSELSPWSAASPANPTKEEIVADDHVYQVTSGPNGAPCPSGALDPQFDAGLKNATAGSKSPFVLKLSREDGSDRLTGLAMTMPKGLVAYLKGVPACPEHVLASISPAELSGRGELSSPACPAASQIGTVQAGAGAGPYPFYASGRAYLAGPYKGAPLSIAAVTPAVAGPFDLGNVVVRNAVHVDRKTARVSVVSDPIPTILAGILLDIRDVRVNIDREGFTAAPTSCERQSVTARISGQGGGSVERSVPFGLGDCAALGFKPKLDLRLFGGTKRGAHPRLRATLTARPGDANIAGAAVTLPRSEFLDQANIRTICTRVQFAAGQGGGANCPAASIYGHGTAITPLLDEPVSGPVYMRSSDNKLPDLVAALRGPDHQPIEAELVGRVDSIRGGIRTTFEGVPDVPVTKFTLTMQGGGKKGLLVNSRDICRGTNRATIEMDAHNGRQVTLRPKLKATCKKARKAKRGKGGARKGR